MLMESNEETCSSVDKPSLIQRLKYFWLGLKPQLLSHHPECGHFEEHMFAIKGTKFCYGCYIGFPMAFFTILFLTVTGLNRIIDPNDLFYFGFYCMCAYILSVLRLTKFKIIKIASKVIIGIGLGSFVVSIFSMGLPVWFSLLIIGGFINITTMIVNFKRSYEIQKECKKCEYQYDWDKCPAMRESSYWFRKSGFLSAKRRKKQHVTSTKNLT